MFLRGVDKNRSQNSISFFEKYSHERHLDLSFKIYNFGCFTKKKPRRKKTRKKLKSFVPF